MRRHILIIVDRSPIAPPEPQEDCSPTFVNTSHFAGVYAIRTPELKAHSLKYCGKANPRGWPSLAL